MSQGGWACPGHVVVSRIKLFKPDSAVHVTCNDSMEALEGRRGLRRAGLPLPVNVALGTTTRAGAPHAHPALLSDEINVESQQFDGEKRRKEAAPLEPPGRAGDGGHLKADCFSLKAACLFFCSSASFFFSSCSWRISSSKRLDALTAWTCPETGWGTGETLGKLLVVAAATALRWSQLWLTEV